MTRTSAKLTLDAVTATSISPGPGGTRSNATNSMRLQVTGGADLQAHAVVLVFDDGGSPFARAQRTRAQACGVPVAVAPRGLVFLGSAEQLQRQLLGARSPSSTSIWVALRCGCSESITRIRPRSPACSRLATSPASTVCGVSGHDVEPGRLARAAPPARGRCRTRCATYSRPRPRQRLLRVGFGRPRHHDDAGEAPARWTVDRHRGGTQRRGVDRVGTQWPGHGRARRALDVQRIGQLSSSARSAASDVLSSSQDPASTCGQRRAVRAAPIRWSAAAR